MTYALNDGVAKEYTGMIKDLPKGNNRMVIKAYDNLGNSRESEIQFIIE